jgi:hypothetical protein
MSQIMPANGVMLERSLRTIPGRILRLDVRINSAGLSLTQGTYHRSARLTSPTVFAIAMPNALMLVVLKN